MDLRGIKPNATEEQKLTLRIELVHTDMALEAGGWDSGSFDVLAIQPLFNVMRFVQTSSARHGEAEELESKEEDYGFYLLALHSRHDRLEAESCL
ncbi:hypothetical protein AVEN_266785-1 [Araneus ventricosus]|uniref:Uncharacterized protein n=1 Tax=Araneus ventricosus TaxID=182803 RepID=A0A4Y2GAC3_ARAVE|nr:hypothetical protein AVEN_266785-1 [Araneus ventricosus]